MTGRLRLPWPDPRPFVDRGPIRILAISDEPDPTLDSVQSRRGIGRLDMVIGCGDLKPEYLAFVADAFCAPLHYVRGNHDVGAAWEHAEREMLPAHLADGAVIHEAGIALMGISGSPRYNNRALQVSGPTMWLRAARAGLRGNVDWPLIVVTHAPPRDVNDDTDGPHRGFPAFRWLARRLHPPLWLHGHTALVRRGLDDRSTRLNGTLFYNCTGATLVELLPPPAGD